MKNTMKKLILALGILGVSTTSFAATRKQPPRPKRNIVKHENKKPAKRTPKAPKKAITKKNHDMKHKPNHDMKHEPRR